MIVADLAKECNVEKVINETLNYFQRIDVLVSFKNRIFIHKLVFFPLR